MPYQTNRSWLEKLLARLPREVVVGAAVAFAVIAIYLIVQHGAP